jgi:hypothetical protein
MSWNSHCEGNLTDFRKTDKRFPVDSCFIKVRKTLAKEAPVV